MSALPFYALAAAVVALDQGVKAWTRAAIPLYRSVPVIGDAFQLTHTRNRGMAFSLLEGQVPLLAVAALVVVAGIVYTQARHGNRLPRLLGVSLALALGGAVGNLIDRLRLGYVTDLFDARIINFPVFNVADTAITFGIGLLAWRVLTAGAAEAEPENPTRAEGATRSNGTLAPAAQADPPSSEGEGAGGRGQQ
jgi:signal peptidase II